ncbi:MAG: SH3 domain-containing protein, partial [Clostridia bacterium]
PPIVFKQGAIKADKLGQAINIYLLPDAASEIITQMLDGDIVNFAQKFDPNSEWTKLQLQNGEGYAQTKYLQPSGLTGLQIALITVSCIIFVAMTTILVIIYLKKKKAKHPY